MICHLTPLIAGITHEESICNEAQSKEENAQRLFRKEVGTSVPKDGELRKCRICGIEKPISEYYIRKEGYPRTECKECMIEMHRYKKLGVCNAKYEEMLVKQKGCCAICGAILNSSRYTKLAVDHDHKTGVVRGLLCMNCNTALGLMKDSVERFTSAIQYLKRYSN